MLPVIYAQGKRQGGIVVLKSIGPTPEFLLRLELKTPLLLLVGKIWLTDPAVDQTFSTNRTKEFFNFRRELKSGVGPMDLGSTDIYADDTFRRRTVRILASQVFESKYV
jgi:hypothetical protein